MNAARLPVEQLRRNTARAVARATERVVPSPAGLHPADGPAYVGVGAQRCGTTRWHALICAHPDAGPPRGRVRREVKELHWFDDPRIRPDRDRYRSRFPHERGLVGEWTPRYLHDRRPIATLASWFPGLRYLVLLRDPLARLDSAVRFARGRGDTVDGQMIADAVDRGCYLAQLRHLYAHVEPAQVLVLQFERCNDDPVTELRRTYEFVGLDPDFVPEDLYGVVNASATPPGSALPADAQARALDRFHAERPELAALLPDLDVDRWT